MTWGRLSVPNHRGVPLPRVLGIALAVGATAWVVSAAAVRGVGRPAWGSLAGCLVVAAAGLVDDLVGDGPRGLRGHLRALADGRVTTGAVKLLVAAGASVVVVALAPARPPWVQVSGIVLIAAATNVWNGLDVRPGRALKAFLPVALAFVLVGPLWLAPAILALLVGALACLPLDLGERAMLGDAGANLLGFAAGLALYLVLPGWAVAVSAAAAAGLNVLAETVTLSRAIAAVPALRWLDRLGRAADADA